MHILLELVMSDLVIMIAKSIWDLFASGQTTWKPVDMLQSWLGDLLIINWNCFVKLLTYIALYRKYHLPVTSFNAVIVSVENTEHGMLFQYFVFTCAIGIFDNLDEIFGFHSQIS